MNPLNTPETVLETRTCKHCHSDFEITDIDADFLDRLAPSIGSERFALPYPTQCPKCRKIRRYAWRNEKNIYKRKCDATGKDIISLFSPDAPCPVYESDYWYSDKWDAHQYGRDFDFSRSFFEQWGELKRVVPMPGKAISKGMENSDYSDNCSNLKDCYLCFNASDNESCLYSSDIWKSTSVIDSLSINECEESYELLDSRNSYGVHYSYDVDTCRDSLFLRNCSGCTECYGCFGLKNKKFYIYNISHSEDAYRLKIAELRAQSIDRQKEEYRKFLIENKFDAYIPENLRSERIQSSFRIFDSHDISHSERIHNSENIRYSSGLLDTRDAMDIDIWGDRLEKNYESLVVGESNFATYFSVDIWANTTQIFYSAYLVNNVHNCFGCIGLRNAKYCILNKQYTKEEYEKLVPKIIEKMRADGEWGEFFPPKYSHFGYNQTMNMIKFPLSKEEARANGYYWSDYEAPFPKVEKVIPGARLPENIDEIPDDILNWAIECEVSGRPFRIVRAELDFYRKHRLPVPRKHPDIRYQERTKIYVNY